MKKVIAIYFFFFIGSTFYSTLSACTCAVQDNFCATARSFSFIIVSEVLSIQAEEYTLQVAILENLHNNISADTLLVTGGNGADCGENVELFTVGDTMIFALSEYLGVYNISICGLHYLSLKDGIVSGEIKKDLASQSFEDFKTDIAACVNITSLEIRDTPSAHVRISPNPSREVVNIELSQGQIEKVEVFSVQGQLMDLLENQKAPRLSFPMKNLKPGIYLFRVWHADGFTVKRVVKM